MQPKTEVRFDRESFERIKRTVKNMSVASRQREMNRTFATAIPEEIGIKLNNGCNLRCKHCFEWNADGFHHDMERAEKKREVDIELVEKILIETRPVKSKVFLWGGEPLYYSKFDQVCDLLEQDPRWTTCCTNAIQTEEKMDSILKISSNLAMLLSLEGFEQENDAIRGRGTFKKVMHATHLLLDLQRKGIYKGKVSIHLTISDAMVPKLYDFLEFFEELGVDSVYFTFPWYLPDDVSDRMDTYVHENFQWLSNRISSHKASWHSFKYNISPSMIDPLIEEMKRINARAWKIRPRYQPALETHEVRDFVLGKEKPAQNRTQCLAISTRMDVMPSGEVSTCKLFPEFAVGNLSASSVQEVWHNEGFQDVREKLSCGLMPVCSKCVLLYLNGR
ncbi:radical SAM protein [Paenibacillus xanthanilyticus]|uniref:Radical SAM protein n=1 Tax=Paenibacillus xanthanilyticus TaxID=1783531 RepID=A0ABV8K5Y9_9BACL